MTLATLLVGLALAPVLGAGVERGPAQLDSRYSVQEPANSERQAEDIAVDVEIETCAWTCEACGPGQGCSQICAEIGDCGGTCDVIARCDAGFMWDEGSCSCVS